MKLITITLALSCAVIFLGACGHNLVKPPEGCRGHNGVQHIVPPPDDATNSKRKSFVTCNDGTVVIVVL